MELSPDSAMTRRAEQLLRASSAPSLVNHCLRSYLWAVAIAEIDKLAYDSELLFVAAALHDLGLEEAFDSGEPFEEDGGRAASEFVLGHGWPQSKAIATEQAVVLHVAADVTPDHGHEAYLLWEATGTDVSGSRLDELPTKWITDVMSAYPRLDFPVHFADRFSSQAARKSDSRAAALVAGGLLDRLAACSLNALKPDAELAEGAGS